MSAGSCGSRPIAIASSAEGSFFRIRALEEIFAALPATDRIELVALDPRPPVEGAFPLAHLIALNRGGNLRFEHLDPR